MININNVEKVYSGKPGCRCGCLGNYTKPEDNKRVVSRIVNTMNRLIEEGAVPETGTNYEGMDFVCVDTETRYYTAYFKGVI